MTRQLLTENQKAFWALFSYPTPNDDIPAVKTATLNGHTFEVSYHKADRKCYDFMPTPTVMVKVDGKRMASKKAYELL